MEGWRGAGEAQGAWRRQSRVGDGGGRPRPPAAQGRRPPTDRSRVGDGGGGPFCPRAPPPPTGCRCFFTDLTYYKQVPALIRFASAALLGVGPGAQPLPPLAAVCSAAPAAGAHPHPAAIMWPCKPSPQQNRSTGGCCRRRRLLPSSTAASSATSSPPLPPPSGCPTETLAMDGSSGKTVEPGPEPPALPSLPSLPAAAAKTFTQPHPGWSKPLPGWWASCKGSKSSSKTLRHWGFPCDPSTQY